MKILKDGRVYYDGSFLIFEGWMFDMEGESVELDKAAEYILDYLKSKTSACGWNNNSIRIGERKC